MRPTTEDVNVEERGVETKEAGAAATMNANTEATAKAEQVQGRKRKLFGQFMQFGIVGASGFIVNQAVFVVARKLFDGAWHIGSEGHFLTFWAPNSTCAGITFSALSRLWLPMCGTSC